MSKRHLVGYKILICQFNGERLVEIFVNSTEFEELKTKILKDLELLD